VFNLQSDYGEPLEDNESTSEWLKTIATFYIYPLKIYNALIIKEWVFIKS
jgi:hypothetical protein